MTLEEIMLALHKMDKRSAEYGLAAEVFASLIVALVPGIDANTLDIAIAYALSEWDV